MTPERWHQLSTIVHAALAREASEREAFIEARCADDAELRRDVESMLATREASPFDPTETPPARRAADAASSERPVVLAPGTRLGPYEMLSLLGLGGMGVVYRARDTKLQRDVALKVLLPTVAESPDRIARFRREAQVLAALNHPNIAQMYGLEESDGTPALVMELVEGPTLADLIARGALPLKDALGIARQIAEALETAHGIGIVHRDLKPANVKVRGDDTVKVLDFGLAKFVESAGAGMSDVPLTETGVGAILGTAAYMPPEQARGKPVDKRADLWAFGCVLFEMLTGRRAFVGDTPSDVLVKIIEYEPDWNRLPAHTPSLIRTLLRRCLAKDPRRRLDSAAVARLEIDEASALPLRDTTSADQYGAGTMRAPERRLLPISMVLIGAVGGLLVAGPGRSLWSVPDQPAPAAPIRRFAIEPPAAGTISPFPFDLSRDGRHLVYGVRTADELQLHLRTLEQLEARPLAGTEGASLPTFSPDGQWVAFVASGKLKKVSVSTTAPPITLSDFPDCCAGSSLEWLQDGRLVAGRMGHGVVGVSSQGGAAVTLVQIDPARPEVDLHSPRGLPGGQALLVGIHRGTETFDVAVLRLDTGERRVIVEDAFDGQYAPTGHLVFARPGALFAAPFDVETLEVTGPPVAVVDNVATVNADGAARYRISEDGSLAYIQSTSVQGRKLVWVDRNGVKEPVPLEARGFMAPSLSPRGDRLAVQIVEPSRRDIWIYDFISGAFNRVTFDGTSASPLWTPDGKRLVFSAIKNGRRQIYWQPADGTGPAELLASDDGNMWPGSWSPDLNSLAYVRNPGTGQNDLGLLRLDQGGSRTLVVATAEAEQWPRISPDGRWLAYVSTETGRFEVYVMSLSGAGGKRQLSTGGGTSPVWSRDGRELFFRSGNQVMVMAVAGLPAAAGKPTALPVQLRIADGTLSHPGYDVSLDGRRLLMVERADEEAAPPKLLVTLNWFEELKARAP